MENITSNFVTYETKKPLNPWAVCTGMNMDYLTATFEDLDANTLTPTSIERIDDLYIIEFDTAKS